jgi:prophage regulatory protein
MAEQLSTALRILRRKQVQDRIGLQKSSLYALIAANKFPRPVRLSARAVGWRAEDVDAWIQSRIATGGAQ